MANLHLQPGDKAMTTWWDYAQPQMVEVISRHEDKRCASGLMYTVRTVGQPERSASLDAAWLVSV